MCPLYCGGWGQAITNCNMKRKIIRERDKIMFLAANDSASAICCIRCNAGILLWTIGPEPASKDDVLEERNLRAISQRGSS